MALKIGSTEISTSAPIKYNGIEIKKVFVKGNPRTVSTSGTIPAIGDSHLEGWETIYFTFDGDVRTWSRSMSFSCSERDAYTASITAVSYSSTSDTTTFTATIENASGLLHTTALSYNASITISLIERLVWSMPDYEKPVLEMTVTKRTDDIFEVEFIIENPNVAAVPKWKYRAMVSNESGSTIYNTGTTTVTTSIPGLGHESDSLRLDPEDWNGTIDDLIDITLYVEFIYANGTVYEYVTVDYMEFETSTG